MCSVAVCLLFGCRGPVVQTQMPGTREVVWAPVEPVSALAPLRELLTDANLGMHRFLGGAEPQRAFSRWDVVGMSPERAAALRESIGASGAVSVAMVLVGFRLTLRRGRGPALAVDGRALVLPSHVLLIGLSSALAGEVGGVAPRRALPSRALWSAAEGLGEALAGTSCRELPLLDPQDLGLLQDPALIRVTSQSLARAYRHLERVCLDAEGASGAHIALGSLTLLMVDDVGALRGVLEGELGLTGRGQLQVVFGGLRSVGHS